MSAAIHDWLATLSRGARARGDEGGPHVAGRIDCEAIGDEGHEGGLERDELLLAVVLQRRRLEQEGHSLAVLVGVGFVGLRELARSRL